MKNIKYKNLGYIIIYRIIILLRNFIIKFNRILQIFNLKIEEEN